MSMNPASFLKNLERIITGHGFKKKVQIPFVAFHTDSSGALLSNTTIATDAVGFDEISNTIYLVWGVSGGSGNVTEISFNFVVPPDYDNDQDHLIIGIKALMGGSTDTPSIDAKVYKNGVNTDLNPTKSAALSSTAAWVTINLSDNGFAGGDTLQISLFPEAHTTDAVEVMGVVMEHKSDLVYYDPDLR